MSGFTSSTIRRIMSSSHDDEDRKKLFQFLIQDWENVSTMVDMLTADPIKVEVPVEKIKVVFAADTCERDARYRFVSYTESRRPIECIRIVRSTLGIALKEAKDLVTDAMTFSNYPQIFEPAILQEIRNCGYYIEKVR